MEKKIRNRAHLLQVIVALVFGVLTWGYAQLGWSLPSTLSQEAAQGRGAILAADGTVLARTAADESGKGSHRVYPQGTLAGQLVGIMGTQEGLEGIEHAYNPQLENGEDITLTIDPRIQAQAEAALAKRLPEAGAESGAVVVLETRSGRILAAASWPPFDPGHWRDYKPEIWRNRPMMDVFEPGSTIKALTVAAALNEGAITPTTVFDTPMKRYVGDKVTGGSIIGDSVPHPARLTTTGILRYSSNVGISHIVERLPGEKLRDYLQAYGYGAAPDLGPVQTEGGILQKDWNTLVKTTSGFGQGMSGTTLQMAAAYNVLANDGLYIPPRLVEGSSPGERREVLTNPAARQIKPMLQTALEGIRHAAAVNGYSCAGKTGTAQIIGEDGKYMDDAYNATYAGFCQTVDPRVTIAVMVHGAKVSSGHYQGSQLAAPIFQELSSSIISMWGLPPENLSGGYTATETSLTGEPETGNDTAFLIVPAEDASGSAAE